MRIGGGEMTKVIVEAHEKALLFRNGEFVRELAPGRHRLARILATERVVKLDGRGQTLTVSGQELMTSDRVTLRLTAVAAFRVVDAVKAVLSVDNWMTRLYTDVQLALREHVGALELEALLRDKGRLGRALLEQVAVRAAEYGVAVSEVALKDVILPGEMKEILNKVMEARKAAEAALIARREELAATRALANTAELLARNPALMKLKVLESLEKIAASGGAKIVVPADFLADRELKKED